MHPKEMATVWVIRGGERNRLVPTFLREGTVGLGFGGLPDGRSVDRATALRLLSSGAEDETPPEAEAAMFLSFVRRIEVGDLVLMPDPQERGLACGVVTGDYEYHDELPPEQCRHRRPVEWRRRLPYAELPERLERVPSQRKALDDVPDGKLRELAQRCCAGELGDDPHNRRSPPVRSSSGGARRPTRPPKAAIPEKRCMGCFVVKPAELFEGDGDLCRDCR
ncbi:MAG: hypothetical protein U5K30_13860 [Acidimicrobiales bacterium]|nr:hypothetical protein [Acidimicrobiales bacterium]